MPQPVATTAPDAVVVGGGVIGLAIAWRAAERGLAVVVIDPAPGRAASFAAAGMLAPVTEASFGEEALTALCLDAAARYPDFVAGLLEVSGHDPGYRRTGTLVVGADRDDVAVLDQLHGFQTRLGLAVTRLRSRECREVEPLLAPSVRGGLLAEDDHSVDNRELATALLLAAERAGVTVVRRRVARIGVAAEQRVTGVLLDDGSRVDADRVVLAAGAWSGLIGGLPEHARPLVRPVRGERLELTGPADPPTLARTVRAIVHGSGVYCVPRADGRIVVGATVEEQGFDTTVTAGGVYELLRDAHAVLPVVTELVLSETIAGLRPGSPDNAPLIGRGALDGLVVATGHHRNGILLTPVTADAVADLLVDGAVPDVVAPFDPQRFAREVVA